MTNLNTPQKNNYFQRWLVILSAALFFCYEYIHLQMFNSISTELMQTFRLNATQFGHLSSLYLYADVVFLLPAGLILDRCSTRTIMLCIMALALVGNTGFALSVYFWQSACCRALVGASNAFCFLSCMRLAAYWFPNHMLALATGLIVTVGMIGGLLAQTPFTVLTHFLSWRTVVLLNSGFGLIVFLLIFIYVQNNPNQQTTTPEKNLTQDIILSLRNTQNWLAGLYASLLNLPIMLLCALWGDLYLVQIYHLSTIQASTVVSMILIGTILGSPIMGAWSDQLRKRKSPMLLGAVLSTLLILILVFNQHLSYLTLLLLFFFIGFCTSTQIIAYPVVTESNPRSITSTATSITSMLIIGGAAFFQFLFGFIMDYFWTGSMAHGVHSYSNNALQHAILILPISFIVAIICAGLLKEGKNIRHPGHPWPG